MLDVFDTRYFISNSEIQTTFAFFICKCVFSPSNVLQHTCTVSHFQSLIPLVTELLEVLDQCSMRSFIFWQLQYKESLKL